MMLRLKPLLMLFAKLALAGLLVTSVMRPAVATTKILTWEDLWPEGEKELTELMYQSYLADLERQLSDESGKNAPPWATPRRGPPGSEIPEGSRADEARQFGSYAAVDALDGQTVQLSGYIVPFNFNAEQEYSEFLLVPYFGACIHAPPPPPNQTVYVRSERPVTIKDISAAYKIEGMMHVEKALNDLGNAAYTLDFKKLSRVN
ncbi:MAG: hypothetical protein CMK09_06105 [Ponticaulis sp.]|nr:hypothetical protein [Ponticaulis sp.]|tara:strand:- start:631 stop:1242 length:612 start_codon:yes stop_codon:yes gene_type:complete